MANDLHPRHASFLSSGKTSRFYADCRARSMANPCGVSSAPSATHRLWDGHWGPAFKRSFNSHHSGVVVQAVCEIAKRQRTSGPGLTRLSHRPSGRVAVIRTPDQRSVAESPFIERVRSILMTPRGVCLQCRSDVSVLDRHASTVDESHVSSPSI